MKLGCCVNMFSNGSDPIGRKYLPTLSRLGYDFVELPLAQVMDLENGEFVRLVEELQELSLPCACFNNFFPAFLRITGKEAAPSGVLDAYLEKALYRAAVLGADKVIFGSSGAKNIPEGFPYDRAYEQLIGVLRRVAAIAKPLGITVGLEPLNNLEGNLIRNLEESARLMKDVASTQIRMMVDYYHFSMEKEKPETLGRYRDKIIHVHIASPGCRTFPGREDMKFLTILEKGGYSGGVSIEAYSDHPQVDLAAVKKVFFMRRQSETFYFGGGITDVVCNAQGRFQ